MLNTFYKNIDELKAEASRYGFIIWLETDGLHSYILCHTKLSGMGFGYLGVYFSDYRGMFLILCEQILLPLHKISGQGVEILSGTRQLNLYIYFRNDADRMEVAEGVSCFKRTYPSVSALKVDTESFGSLSVLEENENQISALYYSAFEGIGYSYFILFEKSESEIRLLMSQKLFIPNIENEQDHIKVFSTGHLNDHPNNEVLKLYLH